MTLLALPICGKLHLWQHICQNLHADLAQLVSILKEDGFSNEHICPLLAAVFSDQLDDVLIWEQVYVAVAHRTPSRRTVVNALKETLPLQDFQH